MILDVSVTFATKCECPTPQEMESWIAATLQHLQRQGPAEVALRIVDADEMQSINHRYRQKDKPTNVLSFPCQLPDPLKGDLLGDILLCAPVILQEAQEQQKSAQSHWAHLVIHGILHLLGYDHVVADEAAIMEGLEIAILHQLGFPNPYNSFNPYGATLTHD